MITIRRHGAELGPYEMAQVVALVQAGQLSGTDMARTEAMETWQPLACLPELSRLFPPFQHAEGSGKAFLITLCVLTILGSIFGTLRGLFYEAIANWVGESQSFWRGWAYVALNAGTLIAAIVMLARRIAGLYVYTACQVLYLLLVGFATVIWSQGAGIFGVLVGATFMLPSLVFLALYWLPSIRKALR